MKLFAALLFLLLASSMAIMAGAKSNNAGEATTCTPTVTLTFADVAPSHEACLDSDWIAIQTAAQSLLPLQNERFLDAVAPKSTPVVADTDMNRRLQGKAPPCPPNCGKYCQYISGCIIRPGLIGGNPIPAKKNSTSITTSTTTNSGKRGRRNIRSKDSRNEGSNSQHHRTLDCKKCGKLCQYVGGGGCPKGGLIGGIPILGRNNSTSTTVSKSNGQRVLRLDNTAATTHTLVMSEKQWQTLVPELSDACLEWMGRVADPTMDCV